MLIKFLSNGVQQHVENSVGRALIAGSLAVEVKPPAPAPPIPVWDVVLDQSGFVCIKLTLGRLGKSPENPQGTSPKSVQFYQGDPAKIHDRKYPDGGVYSSAFGRPVPDDVLRAYIAARRNPDVCLPVPRTDDGYNKEHARDKAQADQRTKLRACAALIPEAQALAAQANPATDLIVIPDPFKHFGTGYPE